MNELIKEEYVEAHLKAKESYKDLYCMGITHRIAKGPNPLSMKRRKVIRKEPKKKKRRLRKGKRSKILSALKKESKLII